MRVQVVPPDWPITCAICPLAVFGLGEVHPGLRRVLHELGVVGDAPADRDVRPQLGRGAARREIVRGVRRRVVGEQVLDPLHQAAVGMSARVGGELAGRRFGLHALDQLPARRADHLDADEGKLLAELVDDLLLHLGEGRGVEEELAFLARRLDQTVGRLVGRRRARAADDREACRGRQRTRGPCVGSASSHLPSGRPRKGAARPRQRCAIGYCR